MTISKFHSMNFIYIFSILVLFCFLFVPSTNATFSQCISTTDSICEIAATFTWDDITTQVQTYRSSSSSAVLMEYIYLGSSVTFATIARSGSLPSITASIIYASADGSTDENTVVLASGTSGSVTFSNESSVEQQVRFVFVTDNGDGTTTTAVVAIGQIVDHISYISYMIGTLNSKYNYLAPCYADHTQSVDLASFANYYVATVTSTTSSPSPTAPKYCSCSVIGSLTSSSTATITHAMGPWCEASIQLDISNNVDISDGFGAFSTITLSEILTLTTWTNVTTNPYSELPSVSDVYFYVDLANGTSANVSWTITDSGTITLLSTDPILTDNLNLTANPVYWNLGWNGYDEFAFTTPQRVIPNCEQMHLLNMTYCSLSGTASCLFSGVAATSNCTCLEGHFANQCSVTLQLSPYSSSGDTNWASFTNITSNIIAGSNLRFLLQHDDQTSSLADNAATLYSPDGSYVNVPHGTYSPAILLDDSLTTQTFTQGGPAIQASFKLTTYIAGVADATRYSTLNILPYPAFEFEYSWNSTSGRILLTFPATNYIPSSIPLSAYMYSTLDSSTATFLEPMYCQATLTNTTTLGYSTIFPSQNLQTVACDLPLIYLPYSNLLVVVQANPTAMQSVSDATTHYWRYISSMSASNSPQSDMTTFCNSTVTVPQLKNPETDPYFYPVNSQCLTSVGQDLGSATISAAAASIEAAILAQNDLIDRGIAETQCLSSCPDGLELDSSCQNCICASDSCVANTRVAQVFFDPTLFSNANSSDPVITGAQLISQDAFLVYAERHFASVLGLTRSRFEYEFGNEATSVGLETISATALTGVLNKNAASSILLYVTITPVATAGVSQIAARWNQLTQRLVNYSTTNYAYTNAPTISEIQTSVTNLLPVNSSFTGQFLRPNTSPLIPSNYYQFIPVSSVSSLSVECVQQSCTSTDTAYEDDSTQYWSSCTAGQTTSTSLNVSCADIYGNYTVSGLWCAPGFVSAYPTVSTLPCDVPSTPTLTYLPSTDLTVTSRNSRSVVWSYSGPLGYSVLIYVTGVTTNYAQLLTNSSSTDTSIQKWPASYSYLLGTFDAISQTAVVTFPRIFDSTTSGTVYIVVKEVPSVRVTATTQLTLVASSLCANVQCSISSQTCFPGTGLCLCPQGMSVSSVTGVCENDCYGQCGSHGTCQRALNSTTNKYVSSCQCSSGWTGTYCDVNTACSTSLCSNHGYQTWNSTTQQCSGVCSCSNLWSGSTCSTCPLTSTCSANGTAASTYSTCSSCICNLGYSGSLCSTRSIYGTIVFGNDTIVSSTTSSVSMSSSLVNSTITTQQNSSSVLATTDVSTIDVLVQDMAWSMNIDSSRVSIQRLVLSDTYQIQTLYTPDDGNQLTKTVNRVIQHRYNITFNIQATSNSGQQVQFASWGDDFLTDDDDAPGYDVSSATNMFPQVVTVPTSVSDLYSAWDNVQSNLPSTPIGTTPATNTLGSVQSANAYDPVCTPSATVTCPTGTNPFTETDSSGNGSSNPFATGTKSSKTNTTTIIIVVVVVVAGGGAAIIGLLILLCILRSKELLCFAPRDDSKPDQFIDPMSGIDLNASSSRQPSHQTSSKSSKTGMSATKSSRNKNGRTTEMVGAVPSFMDDDFEASVMTTMSTTASSTSHTNSTVVVSLDSSDENLPENWEKVQHPSTGEVFYVNKQTLVSQTHSPNESGQSQW